MVLKSQHVATVDQIGGPRLVVSNGTSNFSQTSLIGLSGSILALKVIVIEGGSIELPVLTQFIFGDTT